MIPAVRLEEERSRLRPLKVAPAQLALRVPIVVGPTAAVVHDTHPYSMSPDAIGIQGTLLLYRDRVRIVAGRFEAVHQRLCEPHAKSTLPEHRVQHVAAVSGKRAKRYLQREPLLALGRSALEYLTELTHRRPGIWLSDVDRCTRCSRPAATTPSAPPSPVGSPSSRSEPNASRVTWRPR